MAEMGIGALFHDIGKLDVTERLRYSSAHFSAAEQRSYEDHVSFGIARARKMGLSSIATLVIAQHHEMADGSGVPLHLINDRISLAARVVALINRYDNLCNPHIISQALTPHEAIAQIYAQAQHKFDSVILVAFVKMMGVYPVGSMVRLRSGYLAVVTQQNPVKLTAPEVKVFFSTKQGLRMTPRVLDLADPKCSDRIVGRESNEQWQFAHLDELWAGEEALQKLGRKG
jgi:putative nucleotidyltransferase with HDIG domain